MDIAIVSDLYYGKEIHIIDETWRELAKELLPTTQISWFFIEETKKSH